MVRSDGAMVAMVRCSDPRTTGPTDRTIGPDHRTGPSDYRTLGPDRRTFAPSPRRTALVDFPYHPLARKLICILPVILPPDSLRSF